FPFLCLWEPLSLEGGEKRSTIHLLKSSTCLVFRTTVSPFPSFSISTHAMACLSRQHHRAWLTPPNMLQRCPLSAHHRRLKDDDNAEPFYVPPLSSAYRLFPVYAMGVPDPSPGPDLDGPDPIWAAVRDEAKLEAEKEPILSSFLYASILAHDCFEQALAFVVANRLQNPTLLATQLMDIFCNVIMHDKAIQRSIRLDVQAFKDRDPACLSYCSALLYMKVVCCVLCPQGYHSLQVYRVAHALWHQGRKVLALALQSRVSEVFGVDIHPAAKIGEGILLDHGTGVVIGETAIVGNRVSLMHGVTLGGTGKEIGDRHPKVCDGALIGASATILGNIRIGEGAMIAAGSLVLKDVPPHSIAAGIPAKVVSGLLEHDPSLTMKH
ncbi:putative serine acetyltransferase 2, partial [Mucuna pruriens]